MRPDEYIKIIFVSHGKTQVNLKNEGYEIESGDIILIRPSEEYAIKAISPKAEIILVKIQSDYLYSYNGNIIKLLSCFLNCKDNFQRVHYHKEVQGYYLYQLFWECYDEGKTQKSNYERVIELNVSKILILLERNWQGSMYDIGFNKENVHIKKGIDYIYKNLKDVSAIEVANYVGVSYTYFLKIFKEEKGCAYTKFVHRLRINKAQELLMKTRKNVMEIATEVGFSTASHFIKVFRQYTGVTPSVYRDRQ